MKYHIVQEEERLEKRSPAKHAQDGAESGVSVAAYPKPFEGRLISPAQSFAIKRVMNTAGINPPLASSASVESLERCIHSFPFLPYTPYLPPLFRPPCEDLRNIKTLVVLFLTLRKRFCVLFESKHLQPARNYRISNDLLVVA